MLESHEETSDVRTQTGSPLEGVNETANPSGTPTAATAAGNRETQKPRSTERAADKRFMQRHANVMKARAGHRRNIRRSNTNG
jgi:hypothetical protein